MFRQLDNPSTAEVIAAGVAILVSVVARWLSRGLQRSPTLGAPKPPTEDSGRMTHSPRPRHSSVYRTVEGGIVTRSLPQYPVWRICITGGPCGGKSSSLDRLRVELRRLGFRVYTVPEVATLMIHGGLDLSNLSSQRRITHQRVILQTIMMLEDSFFELASLDAHPSIILCDRGTMDGSAYCEEWEFAEVLRITGYTVAELRDARYDAVVHLVTAAVGAEEAYTTINNSARRENPEEAAALDSKTLRQYVGHRNIAVFDNRGSFADKIQRVVHFITTLVRVNRSSAVNLDISTMMLCPLPTTTEAYAAASARRRLRVEVVSNAPDSVCYGSRVTVSTVMLQPSGECVREAVSSRSSADGILYFHVGERHSNTTDGVCPALQAPRITYNRLHPSEYEDMLRQRHVLSRTCKHVTTFLYEGMHFSVTEYVLPTAVAGTIELSAPYGCLDERLPWWYRRKGDATDVVDVVEP